MAKQSQFSEHSPFWGTPVRIAESSAPSSPAVFKISPAAATASAPLSQPHCRGTPLSWSDHQALIFSPTLRARHGAAPGQGLCPEVGVNASPEN